MVIVGGLVWYSGNAPRDDRLVSQKQLSESVWLYVTQYQDAAATDSDVYRYYLNKHLSDPMKVLQKSGPFLQADSGDATVTAIGDHVLVKLTGKVYSFSNSAFYYDARTPVMPRIDLNATASNPWK
ncbi:hypothetical protein N5923_14790 [Erwiniaceae bacterium BAC15a-03b]|uniref:Uncharacterized protein n=1 Tax=Winslowiella arboricola TaxID=2978220 RepID=A0A9J6PVD0_9GAMM|nr:hypothetical protein [Winslowiella arboricola]MCU5773173.1 hypothetical protein [Winslowiella arboricola]MCU5778756.1 hypothetical protein [Winslowiella arboricola]